jgi:hypothetical protein
MWDQTVRNLHAGLTFGDVHRVQDARVGDDPALHDPACAESVVRPGQSVRVPFHGYIV